MKQTLFDQLGGIDTFRKVHKVFYDKVYAHPWLKLFFEGHNQQAIEDRQTGFMAIKMGGDVSYYGNEPKMAHRAMFITNELFDIRQDLLRESLQEVGIAEDLAKRWLKIDNAFRKIIVKNSIESFYATSWKYEKRIIIPRPE